MVEVNLILKMFSTIFHFYGIQQQVSCLGTPKQNGVAKCKYRHIVETSLTLLYHENASLRLWVNAFLTAIYLINQLHFYVVNNDYLGLMVFGCRYFPTLQAYARNNFQNRTIPCIFIGYCPVHKGYSCLDYSTNKVYIAQHEVIDENWFPNKDQK